MRARLSWLGAVAAVIVAMWLGQLIVEHIPVDTAASDPFPRSGHLGDPVRLRYADVTVTDVLAGRGLTTTTSAAAPSGIFLVLPLTVVARGSDRTFLGFDVVGADGTHYQPTLRGGCGTTIDAPAGVPMHAMLCYDVPRRALPGAHLQFALGAYDVDGAAQRRDDLADIDLGISKAVADTLWATRVAYRGQFPALTPLNLSPEKVPS
jgi:hypothetical protein